MQGQCIDLPLEGTAMAIIQHPAGITMAIEWSTYLDVYALYPERPIWIEDFCRFRIFEQKQIIVLPKRTKKRRDKVLSSLLHKKF